MTDALMRDCSPGVSCSGAIYELDVRRPDHDEALRAHQRPFHQTNSIHKYLTMIYAEISRTVRFRFISAGHRRPAVFYLGIRSPSCASGGTAWSLPPVGMLPSGGERGSAERPPILGYKKSYE